MPAGLRGAARWTAALDDRLAAMWAAGEAAAAITDALGFADTKSIYNRVRALGLPARPRAPAPDRFWTVEKVAALRRLATEQMSMSAIGEALGASRNAVIGKLHRLGIRLSPSEIADARRRGGGTHRKALAKSARLPSDPVNKVRQSRAARQEGVDGEGKPGHGAEAAPPIVTREIIALAPDDGSHGDTACMLMDRTIDQCCFPLWGDGPVGGAGMLYCGAPAAGPYCAAHRARMYVAVDTRQPRRMREAPR